MRELSEVQLRLLTNVAKSSHWGNLFMRGTLRAPKRSRLRRVSRSSFRVEPAVVAESAEAERASQNQSGSGRKTGEMNVRQVQVRQRQRETVRWRL
jgi:hypothetical protein